MRSYKKKYSLRFYCCCLIKKEKKNCFKGGKKIIIRNVQYGKEDLYISRDHRNSRTVDAKHFFHGIAFVMKTRKYVWFIVCLPYCDYALRPSAIYSPTLIALLVKKTIKLKMINVKLYLRHEVRIFCAFLLSFKWHCIELVEFNHSSSFNVALTNNVHN